MIAKASALAPAAKAVARAKEGKRYRLNPPDVRPGCIAWMPFASVIKVTHRDHHKGASDGVEVIYEASQKSQTKYSAGDNERPRRRAWNHPCVIVRKEQSDVWILGMTTYKGRTLEEKLAKYPLETRRRHAKAVVPMAPTTGHMLAKEGDKRYKPLLLQRTSSKAKEVGGYVKLSTVYKMDWRDLQTFNGSNRCLDEESTARLVGLVGSVCGLEWAKVSTKDMRVEEAKKEAGQGMAAERKTLKMVKAKPNQRTGSSSKRW